LSDTYSEKATAERYDSARSLPDETLSLWMNTLKRYVPAERVARILDLGGGTGRFTDPIWNTYKCPVIVVDPSEAMLRQGMNAASHDHRVRGKAEYLPLAGSSVDLVWMSQVFHHFENSRLATTEIWRVLKDRGYLAVRNGTRESDALGPKWIDCFPEAKRFNQMRTPSQSDIVSEFSYRGFDVIDVVTVDQIFAGSYDEYYRKIAQRGLSSLITISDEAFERGLLRLREWIAVQPTDRPVYDPVALMVFRKKQ
jgi:ubiquinone/menaquinone biosynthesis C-methylase UbiE